MPSSTKAAKSPKRSSKAEHGTSLRTAFQEIRELIVHGKLSPGTWIVEGDLARHLGMSRTPVRGALHWLQREGYIRVQRNVSKSRMFVAPLTKDDANELYSIIGRLEGMAGRSACALPKADRLVAAEKLTAINDQLRQINESPQSGTGSIFDLDRDFHRIIIAVGAGPRLAVLHGAIEPQTERYWRLYASSIIGDLHLSVEEHNKIISALVAGDGNKMERGLLVNWENGAERLARVIAMFGERGSW